MNAGVKISELGLEILTVFLPCYAVHSGGRVPLQPEVGTAKQPGINMVEERGEPFPRLQPCSCPYAVQSRGHACPARGPARAGLSGSPRPLPFAPPAPVLRSPASQLSGRRRRARLLSRWPPSAAQTGRAVFPHPAFTKTQLAERQWKGSS